MGENSEISWTDHTFNPWIGCTKVSPACTHCYAERDMDHRFGKVAWGPSGTRVLTSDANWRKPLKWNHEQVEYIGLLRDDQAGRSEPLEFAPGNIHRPRVFCASLADVFEDWKGPMADHRGLFGHVFSDGDWVFGPDGCDGTNTYRGGSNVRMLTMNDVRARLFKLIDATPHLDWMLLTKRPENIQRMWPTEYDGANGKLAAAIFGNPGRLVRRRDNVWLGTSVENQEYADKRIPELLKCRDLAPVLFLSCEPLVGTVKVDRWFGPQSDGQWMNVVECGKKNSDYGINWLITGGESGPGARPADPNWFRSLRDQCSAAGVPFHFKQFGEFDETQTRVGKKKAGRLLDGVTHDAFPQGCNSAT